MQTFFGWHNDDHHHAGLALFTPADVFFDRIEKVRSARQAALDVAYTEHPERFPNGPPVAASPPSKVCINPIENDPVAVQIVQPTSTLSVVDERSTQTVSLTQIAGPPKQQASSTVTSFAT